MRIFPSIFLMAITIRAVFFAAPAWSSELSSSFQVVINPSSTTNLSSDERAELESWLQSTLQKFPESMKTGIGRRISLDFVPMGQGAIVPHCPGDADTDPDHAVHSDLILGRLVPEGLADFTHSARIEMNEALIPEILSGPTHSRTYGCGHRNTYRLAQATLLHELAHAYDFSDLFTPEERLLLLRCEIYTEMQTDPDCVAIHKIRGQVSDRPAYRARTEIFESVVSDQPKNRLLVRSPDPYEFANAHESFAVNFEYFALDPEYACRRPSMQALLSRTLQSPGASVTPPDEHPCERNTTVRLSGTNLAANLDPSRIYQVHYLFAGQGKELMSRWGHAMLRLVICAPDRKEVSEACLADTASHVVVSYRANVSDVIVNYLTGLFGGYPSQVFFHSLPEIVEEYSHGELRSLTSIPLALTEQQKAELVGFITEQYWTYSGGYYFLTNNCASEVRDTLHAILPPDHPFQKEQFLSPLGLKEAILATGLGDESVLKDERTARKMGYTFEAGAEALAQALAGIHELAPGASGGLPSDLDGFLSQTDPETRRTAFEAALREASDPTRQRRIAAAFYLLENQARRNLEQELQSAGVKLLENSDSAQQASSPSVSPSPLDLLRKLQADLLPWRQIHATPGAPNYGVPRPSETPTDEEMRARVETYSKLFAELEDWLKAQLPDLYQELQESKENLRAFAQALRK